MPAQADLEAVTIFPVANWGRRGHRSFTLRVCAMKAVLLIAIAAVVLCGCAQRYRIMLTNGNGITTSSKPKLNTEGTAYVYKDLQGREAWVSAGRVKEIAPE